MKYTVGQLSKKCGLSARAIRHYEDLGLIQSTSDIQSNYRHYDENVLMRLNVIILLKGISFSLMEISEVINSKGSKTCIVNTVSKKIKYLKNKSSLFDYCIEILNEFLIICQNQKSENINGLQLLNELKYFSDNVSFNKPDITEQNMTPSELKYIEDRDMEFLQECNEESLYDLDNFLSLGQDDVDLLLYNMNIGTINLAQGQLAGELYKPQNYWKYIAAQIQRHGATVENSIYKNDKSILYIDILFDICKKFGFNHDNIYSSEVIEQNILTKLLFNSVEKMEQKELKALANYLKIDIPNLSKLTFIDFVSLEKLSGFTIHRISYIIRNAVQRYLFTGYGLSLAEKEALDNGINEFAWAFDWTIKELWTMIDFLGQPYKTTFPIVIQIAYMRINNKYRYM